MAWIDLSSDFGYGTILTSTQMQNLRDNITALANGDSGAPAIQQAALDSNVINQTKMADDAIGQAELKETFQEQSFDIATDDVHLFALTGGEYCFFPTVKGETTDIRWGSLVTDSSANLTTAYQTIISLYNNDSGNLRLGYVRHRYIQASGEIFWVFILRDKITKKNIGISACPDHPCFGNDRDPEKTQHVFGNAYDPAKHEIIVINPSQKEVLNLEKKTTFTRSILEIIEKEYEIDDAVEPEWPNIPVTVGLPIGWEEKQMGEKIKPIKKIIPKPDYIKTAALKLKV